MNTALDISFSLSTGLKAVAFALSCIILAHVLPFLFDPRRLRSYPGPLLARLSDLWLSSAAAHGKINRAVMDVHQTYGPIVRIAPNHISVADPSALHTIYGHGAGILKADMYDAFVSVGRRSIFSTRSREEHTRKRKNLAHTFSQKSTSEFEPVVRQYLAGVVKQWDRMCSAAASGKAGVIGEMAWRSQGGRAVFDSLKWYNFMVFDIIGDLVFRAPFGMTERGTDMARIAKRPDQALASFESSDTKLEYDMVNAVEAVNERSTFLVTLGMMPAWSRPLLKSLPLRWSRVGVAALDKMAAMAITAVANRSQYTETRNDILAKYFEARDEHGQALDNVEISTEAITLLIAGTDTTSNSAAAITFYLAQNPDAQAKLQAELDEALGAPTGSDVEVDEPILAPYDDIKNLPYLQDVVNEGLRLFSTVGVGLPRIVPEDGLTVLGHTFAPGTVVSVPTYVVHRDKEIWGKDADMFNPDRWAKGDKITMMKAFAPFSVGPRACIGRNLALMELLTVVANIFHRYDVVPAYPGQTMDVHDGFLRKPIECTVSVKRRAAA